MAISWAEVVRKPEFQKLPANEQAIAKEHYFAENVAPRVPEQERAAAKTDFDAFMPEKANIKPDLGPRADKDKIAPVPTPGEGEDYGTRFVKGAGMGLQNMGLGIKGMFVAPDEEDKKTIDRNREYVQTNPWSAGMGSLVPTVVEAIVPQAVGAKLLRTIPAASRVVQGADGVNRLTKGAKAARIGTAIAIDAANAAAVSPEDRGLNAIMAGGLSGAGQAAYAGGRGAGRFISDKLSATGIGQDLLKAASKGKKSIAELLQQLDTSRPNTPGLRQTAAQATQEPTITQLERANRATPDASPSWVDNDARQTSAIYDQVSGLVRDADTKLANAKLARDQAATPIRERALERANQQDQIFRTGARDLALGQLGGVAGANPSASKLATMVLNVVKEQGDEGALKYGFPTAERLYSVRKNIGDALKPKGITLSEMEASAKDAGVHAKDLKKGVDNVLNDASGGEWQKYLDAFKAGSKDVNNAEALNEIRKELLEQVGPSKGVNQEGNPIITRSFLARLIEKHGTGPYGDKLSTSARKGLEDVRKDLQRMEAPQANYRGGASPAGTGTAADAAALASALGAPNLLTRGLATGYNFFSKAGGEGRAKYLAKLLQDQDAAARGIRAAQQVQIKRARDTPAARLAGSALAGLRNASEQ
jgi:hypothetical protein